MTAGRGIAHSEYSIPGPGRLYGLQLWVALPEPHRHGAPGFEHHRDLPRIAAPGATTTVVIGELDGARSPASVFSPLVGAEVRLDPGVDTTLPLERDFEYGVLAVDGDAMVDGTPLAFADLCYLGWGADGVRLASARGATLMLLGGEPLSERLLMWWNFVGRDHDEIVAARQDWEGGQPRFGTVVGDPRPRLPAPPMPTTRLLPRPSRPSRG